MMTSYFNLLKYAATGIASPDMTYYDKLRASTLMGGAVQTMTGIPPLSFKSDGTPLISWSMKGNGSQSGTPTPDAPIMPEFVGVRTAQLFDKSAITTNAYISNSNGNQQSSYETGRNASDYIEVSGLSSIYISTGGYTQSSAWGAFYDDNKSYISGINGYNKAYSVPANAKYMRLTVMNDYVDSFMLNLGSTDLPYEPYGWAEKITCAGQTTPVYLGQVSTVRRVRKLVFDGTENWQAGTENFYIFIAPMDGVPYSSVLCTHSENSVVNNNGNALWIKKADFPDASTAADFKSYLAEEYAAGTPVTVWYVLVEPTTGIINEPLAKIGDYADELHSTDAGVAIPTAKGQNTLTVDTELQPSEMTITYRG